MNPENLSARDELGKNGAVDFSAVRVVVFDVYGTLLRVRPTSPATAAERFHLRWAEVFGQAAPGDWPEWQARLDLEVEQQQARARRAGVCFPEINWPVVVGEVLREWRPEADSSAVLRWAEGVVQCGRDLAPMPGAVEVLTETRRRGWRHGMLSNAQAYTSSELREAFGPAWTDWGDFLDGLTVWSYDVGFSKPSPEIFQMLTQRAQRLGVASGEILMVGDRADNDLQPAWRAGWQAWLVDPSQGLLPLAERLRDALLAQD